GAGNDLTVSGNAVFNTADVTGLGILHVTGTTADNVANISGFGTQTYDQAVTLGADTTLTGVGVTFAKSVDGSHTLTVNDSGTTTFNGALGSSTALKSLTVTTNDGI